MFNKGSQTKQHRAGLPHPQRRDRRCRGLSRLPRRLARQLHHQLASFEAGGNGSGLRPRPPDWTEELRQVPAGRRLRRYARTKTTRCWFVNLKLFFLQKSSRYVNHCTSV